MNQVTEKRIFIFLLSFGLMFHSAMTIIWIKFFIWMAPSFLIGAIASYGFLQQSLNNCLKDEGEVK